MVRHFFLGLILFASIYFIFAAKNEFNLIDDIQNTLKKLDLECEIPKDVDEANQLLKLRNILLHSKKKIYKTVSNNKKCHQALDNLLYFFRHTPYQDFDTGYYIDKYKKRVRIFNAHLKKHLEKEQKVKDVTFIESHAIRGDLGEDLPATKNVDADEQTCDIKDNIAGKKISPLRYGDTDDEKFAISDELTISFTKPVETPETNNQQLDSDDDIISEYLYKHELIAREENTKITEKYCKTIRENIKTLQDKLSDCVSRISTYDLDINKQMKEYNINILSFSMQDWHLLITNKTYNDNIQIIINDLHTIFDKNNGYTLKRDNPKEVNTLLSDLNSIMTKVKNDSKFEKIAQNMVIAYGQVFNTNSNND